MSNLTRIKNNQITDSSILANVKVVPGSIVGSLFNSNLTMSSDVTITGNLTVQGSSTYLTVASTNTYVNDPLIVLNNAFAGTNTYDIGLVINRGSLTDVAWIWNEANDRFEATYTTEDGSTYGTINNSGYANDKVGSLVVNQSLEFNGTLSGRDINNTVIGNVTPAAATFTTLTTQSTTNLSLTTATAINNTPIGNATPSTGVFTSLTANTLTSGRVVLAGTGGLLEDSSKLTFSTDSL
jgi:hypothetical protein